MNSLKWMALAVVVMLSNGAAEAQVCVKTVRWFDDAPYSFRGKGGVIQGSSVDLVRAVLTDRAVGVAAIVLVASGGQNAHRGIG